MPTPLQQAFLNLGERIDEDVVGLLYERASLSTEEIIAEFTQMKIRWDRPDTFPPLTRNELEINSLAIVKKAQRRASLRGALTGTVGFIAIPPEVLASMIQLLQLSQKLAVVWGHDPNSDRGRILLIRSFSHALGVSLPDHAPLSIRLGDIRKIATKQLPDLRHTGVLLGLSLARHSLGRLRTGLARSLPFVGALAGGIEARRSISAAATKMIEVYSRAWRGGTRIEGPVEDAMEVTTSGLAADLSAR